MTDDVERQAHRYAKIYRKLDTIFAGEHEDAQLAILEVKIAEICSEQEDAHHRLRRSLENIGRDFVAFRRSLREEGINLD